MIIALLFVALQWFLP